MSGGRAGDIVSGAALLALAALYLIGARDLQAGQGEPGPAFLPTVLGVLLAALAVAVVARALVSRGDRRAAAEEDAEPPGSPLRPALAALATLAYAALFEPLGFAPATLLYAAALTALFTRTRGVLLAMPPAVTLLLWGFFRLALGVRLPAGPFG